jgi:hypothetical protein
MNRFELPSDEIKVNDKCIIIRAAGYPQFIGLEVEVIKIHTPPVIYTEIDGSTRESEETLYRVIGPHLPTTPPINGVCHKSWLAPKQCLMKVPPEAVLGDIDVEEDLGGIMVPEGMSKSILEWLDDQHEKAK